MKTALISLFLLISTLSFSQSDYRPGYIVQLNGDTIKGLIDFRGNVRNSQLCNFMNAEGQEKQYRPFDIRSYRFTKGKYYVSKKVKHENDELADAFVEYLVDGEKDLYYYRTAEGNFFLITYNDSTVVTLPYRKTTVVKEGKYYGVQSTQHIGFLKSYFNDAPELSRQIESITHPNSRNLTKLAKDYHDLKCNSTECIVYSKQDRKFSLAVEPVFGYYKANMFADYKSQYGIQLYFWLPQNNENVYAKSGLLFTTNTLLSETATGFEISDYKIYTIPIAFEYQMAYKRIKPKFDLGINMHLIHKNGSFNQTGLSLFAGAGLLVKISSFLYLNAELTSDVVGFASETDLIKGLGYRGGIYFKL
ncbi:hypothetical protein [Carboxylicivirga taeanensis]|uniref:hypothetical protein n=1 Tax=Carboxylicivirga taeanensis TaxID=1416875 RepID=UPI003F6E2ECA